MIDPQAGRTPREILGFSHVNLHVDDLDAARRFYGGALALEELPRPASSGPGAWFRVGDLQLHLSVADAPPAGATTHVALALPAEGFVQCVSALQARGVQLTRGPMAREQLGTRVQTAFCRDPAGNLIELTDVGPLGPRC